MFVHIFGHTINSKLYAKASSRDEDAYDYANGTTKLNGFLVCGGDGCRLKFNIFNGKRLNS